MIDFKLTEFEITMSGQKETGVLNQEIRTESGI